jgi:hypothetical protein
VRPREHIPDARIWAAWNARFAGKIAGNIGLRGYRYTRLAGTHHVWHRIIGRNCDARMGVVPAFTLRGDVRP